MQVWVKICGVTRVDDAHAVQAAGADCIGVNFASQSARFVEDLSTAEKICTATSLTRAGVFLDPSTQWVRTVTDTVPLDLLQFHGAETADFCEQFEIPYIKVLSVRPDSNLSQLAEPYTSAWAFLLDTFAAGKVGGTGQTFDWQQWPGQWPDHLSQRLILAGGLTPDNVAAAVVQTDPFGVDVAGGVEGMHKGEKDATAIEQFVLQARNARGG